MFARVVAALLILGWMSLAGCDVVEDLDEAPGRSTFTAADDEAAGSKRAMGPLANNIIESASRTRQLGVLLASSGYLILRRELNSEFRKRPQLHKLFRVFLI